MPIFQLVKFWTDYVYSTADVPLSDKDIDKKMRANNERLGEYMNYQTLHSFGCVLLERLPEDTTTNGDNAPKDVSNGAAKLFQSVQLSPPGLPQVHFRQ